MISSAMNPLSERIAAILDLDPSAPALEFDARWYSWRDLASTAADVDRAVQAAGVGEGAAVGVLLRNRPVPVGLVLGVLRAGATLVTINPTLGADRVHADLASLDVAVLAGEGADIEAQVDAELGARCVVLALDDLGADPEIAQPNAPARPGPSPGVAVRMLTSGTTGSPRRIDLTYKTLWRVMQGAKHYEANKKEELRLRTGVVVVNSPMVHLGGLFRIIQAVTDGRSFALLERFAVEPWIDAVRRHQPRTVSLVPAALRMVYDADLDPADFASVQSVVSGTAPLDPDLAEAFTARYGVPVLTSYAATEFGGGVAGWNLKDYQQFAHEKRGSVGRAHAGCELRVVDEASGDVLPTGAVGLLEVRTAQVDAEQWIRTTDLARLDDDGFLWIVGRADQTILRGGFKVQPETVRVALLRHPTVVDAVVFGIDDERLGQVPVAVVQPVAGAAVTETELVEHVRSLLAPYEVPVTIAVVDALPRTPSQKVDLAATREWFATRE
jgi:acyl-CoA synthetase (AMP-forming)/AMP-acid ligase II